MPVETDLLRSRRWIRRNSDSFSVQKAADVALISPFHFHRNYCLRFGETPFETANRERFLRASHLLNGQDFSVSEIAIEVGFTSFSSFAAWFKSIAGVSPKEFRKNPQDANKVALSRWRMIGDVMKAKITHTTIYVDSQDTALDFYTNQLGFIVSADVTIPDGFRWLTVTTPESGVELILMPMDPHIGFSAEVISAIALLQQNQMMWACTLLVDDCESSTKELIAKGVRVVRDPVREDYGVEAHFLDNSGNLFSLISPL